MELLLSGEPSTEAPSVDLLLRWFGGDHDPSEFLVLRDVALGEIRATAPQAGLCLLQTEGVGSTAPGGELELSPNEAARLFVQFLDRDPEYRAAFAAQADRGSFSWIGWLVGVSVAAAAWWGWNTL